MALQNSSRDAAARVDSVESELKIEQECRQQMQETHSSDKEKLDRARRELASMKKIKQVCYTKTTVCGIPSIEIFCNAF